MTTDIKTPVKPPLSERVISLSILTLLALIAVGIFIVQFDVNPALVQLNPDSILSGQPRPASPVPTSAAMLSLPEGYSAMTPSETFDAATLSDKINGKAELYLSAGFKQLQSQRIGVDASPDRWFEIFVFDMATQENAFAVYSSQQREDATPVDLGPHAYATANALFWVHGPFYLELIATEGSDAARASMLEIAHAFNQDTPVAFSALKETDLFPAQGLDNKSITLIPADAFGFEKFDRVFVAEYTSAETVLTAFISKRETPEEAERLGDAYRQFLVAFGGKSIVAEEKYIVEIMDAYEIIFTHGPFIAGIHEASDRERAMELARSLQARLKDTNDRP